MLTLRPFAIILLLLCIPLVALLLFPLNTPARILGLILFLPLSASLFKQTVWQPLRILGQFRRFARQHGFHIAGSLTQEPILTGSHNQQPFVLGLSAHLVRSTQERYRTLISSPVLHGVPEGFRLFAPESSTWTSTRKLPEIPTPLGLYCEACEPKAAQDFITTYEPLIQCLFQDFPDALIHGGFSHLPATQDASGRISIALFGRVTSPDTLLRAIEIACTTAQHLSTTPAPPSTANPHIPLPTPGPAETKA